MSFYFARFIPKLVPSKNTLRVRHRDTPSFDTPVVTGLGNGARQKVLIHQVFNRSVKVWVLIHQVFNEDGEGADSEPLSLLSHTHLIHQSHGRRHNIMPGGIVITDVPVYVFFCLL